MVNWGTISENISNLSSNFILWSVILEPQNILERFIIACVVYITDARVCNILLNDKLKTIHHILFANFNRLQWMLYLALYYKSTMRIIFLYLYFMVIPKSKFKILSSISFIIPKWFPACYTVSNNSWYIISNIGIHIVKMSNLCFVHWISCQWHYTSWIVLNGPFADYLRETL